MWPIDYHFPLFAGGIVCAHLLLLWLLVWLWHRWCVLAERHDEQVRAEEDRRAA